MELVFNKDDIAKSGKKFGLEGFNTTCINQVASTILNLLDVKPGEEMFSPIERVLEGAKAKFSSSLTDSRVANSNAICDRIVMYNPDAIAYWIFGRYYRKYFSCVCDESDFVLPMLSVFPPKTPVCFASMYSGLMPEKHGIKAYVKPVLKCTTIFDRLIEEGKKVAIVSTEGDSISLIFLERKMDYFIYKTVAECNAKAAELIKSDDYDVIVLYNTDYDYWMHRNTPTGPLAIRAIKQDVNEFCALKKLIENEWKGKHRTGLAFAPDHGCHRWYGVLGQHELNEPCDMNTVHAWSFV
ncbi:MAG: alkaline phosphatase family protein [Treponemataceae bacterium]|nr:alkaline phosphatase family protein [Spirochaetales bacterium]MDY6030587.1 alkaline phosphatase family protein [Treponemataceae bacterium]